MTPDARQRMAARTAYLRQTSDQGERNDPGLGPPGAYDDPERLTLAERCLLGFGSTSGPPVLPNYFYNNLHQIVQTKDAVMILTEMVHDARIVRMNQPHLPPTVRKWLGDSVGRWEGDTLVVDTTNFTEKTRFRGATENLHIVERFTRVDANTLRYKFTIEDPETWEQPWTGEYTWPVTQDHLYEYACHEGNYAMGNILRGARLRESDDAKTKSKQYDHEVKRMRTKVSITLGAMRRPVARDAGDCPVVAHHAFGGEFDPNKPVLLKGKVTKIEWVNPHAWIHVEITEA